MKGCTEPFAVALLMQMEINWRPVVIGSIDEQLVADVVLDPYIRILVQFCDVPFSTSEVESSPIHSTANPNTHFPPTVIAARSLFLAILKAYLVTIAEPPPGELNVREGMLAEKGPSWLQTRVITPALHASCAQLQVFGFKILSLLTANITAPLSYRERGIVIPVSLEFVLRNASVSCSSEIHQARGAAISLYGHIKQECWQQVSLPERSTVINDAIRLSKDTVGSVRECALRVLGLVIANGIFTWSNHDAEHSNIIEMRLRSLETNVLCVLTDGLRDSKLTVSLITFKI